MRPVRAHDGEQYILVRSGRIWAISAQTALRRLPAVGLHSCPFLPAGKLVIAIQHPLELSLCRQSGRTDINAMADTGKAHMLAHLARE